MHIRTSKGKGNLHYLSVINKRYLFCEDDNNHHLIFDADTFYLGAELLDQLVAVGFVEGWL